MSALAKIAHASDSAVARARAELVSAVREAAADGMSQREIARQIGRSQPEVSRLLRFHGTSPLARRLRVAREEVLRLISEVGGSNVRVFGSLATESEDDSSDIDLLFTMSSPLSLMEISILEDRLTGVVGHPVDVVPESVLRPAMRSRILAEAVPL